MFKFKESSVLHTRSWQVVTCSIPSAVRKEAPFSILSVRKAKRSPYCFWSHSEACQGENVPCCLIQHATSESAPCRVSALCQPPMSFISTEPQSRVVLESHNNYLFAKFDTQLRIIADRYLSFFRERFINLLQVAHFPLTNHSSGVASKQPSQLLWKYQIAAILTDSLEVLILYGNSVARQKLLMPHSTLVLNQLRQGEHGTK